MLKYRKHLVLIKKKKNRNNINRYKYKNNLVLGNKKYLSFLMEYY